ncbi:TSL-kinase interacting protein 1 [Salvia divinorum]|uniref:TSL-kinase interacting protein 1 n=1 Tax=Salvia divinorum TaxID=28513 RepID=A0ABD1IHZ7_SALDI
MKSYGPQKRKRVDVNINQDECIGANVKKPANGTGQEPQSSLECLMRPHLDPPIKLQVPSRKIKLQLFPINEQTRLGLEKDGHNPFLELTLSARKRISSVVRHLNAKWSSSSAVTGQLMLFPYNTKLEQLESCRRWTLNDSAFSVWEVYIDVGSPSIFRLRYGWLCHHQPEMFVKVCNSSLLKAHTSSEDKNSSPRILVIPTHQEAQTNESCEVLKIQGNADRTLHSDVNELKASDALTGLVDDKVTTETDPVCPSVPWDDDMTMLSIGGLLSEISLQGKISGSYPSSISRTHVQPIAPTSDLSIRDLLSQDSFLGKMRCPSMQLENESSLQPLFLGSSDVSIGGLFSEASLLAKLKKSDSQSAEAGLAPLQSPWDDNFTTLSIGGLLSEASLEANAGCMVESKEIKSSFEPLAPSQKPKLSMHEANLSILDAEETCHAFPIQKLQSNRDVTTSNARVGSDGGRNVTSSKQSQIPRAAKTINGMVFPKDSSRHGLDTDRLACPVGTFDEDRKLWPFRDQSAGAG